MLIDHDSPPCWCEKKRTSPLRVLFFFFFLVLALGVLEYFLLVAKITLELMGLFKTKQKIKKKKIKKKINPHLQLNDFYIFFTGEILGQVQRNQQCQTWNVVLVRVDADGFASAAGFFFFFFFF